MPYKDYNKKMAEHMLRRYHQRRGEALERLGGKCVACGTPEELEIDHIDPAQKSFGISKFWSVSKLKFDKELSKCQLLCKSCHEEKSSNEHGKKRAKGTHGTLSSYKYCKCPECKAAKAAYMKGYKKNRKLGA